PPMNPNSFWDAPAFAQRNRVVTDSYEPGSVNKVITASAAIEAGIATPATKLKVPDHYRIFGRTFHDFETHATQTMTYAKALAESSNIATIKMAQRSEERR